MFLLPIASDVFVNDTLAKGETVVAMRLENYQFNVDNSKRAEKEIQNRIGLSPLWPQISFLTRLTDSNELGGVIGPYSGIVYRKPFLRADAPWMGEYVQVLLQAGTGLDFFTFRPAIHLHAPIGYQVQNLNLNITPGLRYHFNGGQPLVEGIGSLSYRLFDFIELAGLVHLKMDMAKLQPQDGTWGFGGGLRYLFNPDNAIQLSVKQETPPPAGGDFRPDLDTLRFQVLYQYSFAYQLDWQLPDQFKFGIL
jgi:hypothetical protein